MESAYLNADTKVDDAVRAHMDCQKDHTAALCTQEELIDEDNEQHDEDVEQVGMDESSDKALNDGVEGSDAARISVDSAPDPMSCYFDDIDGSGLAFLNEEYAQHVIVMVSSVVCQPCQLVNERRLWSWKSFREALKEARAIKGDGRWKPLPLPTTIEGVQAWNEQNNDFKQAELLKPPDSKEGKSKLETIGEPINDSFRLIALCKLTSQGHCSQNLHLACSSRTAGSLPMTHLMG